MGTSILLASKDNGPFWSPDHHTIPISSVTEMISNVRNLMELGVDKIAVFDSDNKFKALWIDEVEPEPDGEGGFLMPRACYTLYRANRISEKMLKIYCTSLPPLPQVEVLS